MDIATTDFIAGKELVHLGLVQGNTVNSKHIGKDIMAGLQTIIGGEIQPYTELMREARKIATDRMIQDAQSMGADAIIAVRYSTAQIMETAAEIMVYGTAVRYK